MHSEYTTDTSICQAGNVFSLDESINKMVPFYGTVYKSSRYDLIITLPACESGAEREKRHAVVFASGETGKSE